MSTERFEYLFNLYIHQKISAAQEAELMQMLLEPANAPVIKSRIDKLYDENVPQETLSEDQISRILGNIMGVEKRKRSIGRTSIQRLMVAASLFFILLAGVVWYQGKAVLPDAVVVAKEIKAPSEVKAFIVLSNGIKLAVNEIKNDSPVNIEGIYLKKHPDGRIEYTGTTAIQAYHTLHNPAGSKTIYVILGDGSKIWLNSGSTLTYPVAFTGRERKVEMNGEALFDVAHNSKKPFIVQKQSTQVKVLGTVFNVKAYDDSKAVEVTLVKGKVVVRDREKKLSATLSAGQQAKVNHSLHVIETPDVEAAVAWKNETFVFNNQSIREIGYTLSRWYDVEVEFKNNNLNTGFSGIISRNASLTETLKMLKTGGVAVELLNNKIIFSP